MITACNDSFDEQWEAFKEGDKAAFETIYRQHAGMLFDYGIRISGDATLVEDCIQELFIELWKSRARLASTTSVKFYLIKALRYKIMDAKQHPIVSRPVEDFVHLFKNSSHEDLYIEQELESEQSERLRKALAKLPERQLEAVELRYFHNFSNEEVARIMGINYHSACKLIYAAIGNLRESFKISVMWASAIALISMLLIGVENFFRF